MGKLYSCDSFLKGTIIPLEQMEALEKKYNIHLHVIQYADVSKNDEYFELKDDGSKIYLGKTLEEVENKLKNRNI